MPYAELGADRPLFRHRPFGPIFQRLRLTQGMVPMKWFSQNPGRAILLAGLASAAGLVGCQDAATPGPNLSVAPDSFYAVAQPQGFAVRDLGTLGGDSSVAHAISQFNRVVGMSKLASGEIRAF